MVNFGPLATEISWLVWGTPANFNGFHVLASLQYCSDVAQRKPTKLCTMLGRLLGWYTIYTFSEAVAPLPLMEFWQVQNLLYVQMCCMQLIENIGHKKIAKKLPSGHHRTTLSGYIFATKTCIDNRKKLAFSYIGSVTRNSSSEC